VKVNYDTHWVGRYYRLESHTNERGVTTYHCRAVGRIRFRVRDAYRRHTPSASLAKLNRKSDTPGAQRGGAPEHCLPFMQRKASNNKMRSRRWANFRRRAD